MNIDKLSKEQVDEIFGVILDSEKQNELMNDVNNQNAWMLDFVFDSKLRFKLEKYANKLNLEEELKNSVVKNEDMKIKKI